MKISRRTFLTAGALSLLGYSRLVEPELLECTEKQVRLGRTLARAVRILHLTDLHWSSVVSLRFLDTAFDLGLQLRPDIICLTGDFVTGREMPLRDYLPLLKRLSSRCPTYASLGNHDGGAWAAKAHGYPTTEPILALLREAGITTLFNQATTVVIGTQEIVLIGLGDLWAGDLHPVEAFKTVNEHDPRLKLVLSHNPDSKELLGRVSWDLMLSGHTHGGQFVVPVIGAAPFAPVKDHRYVAGLHPWEGRQIHVSRGVGNLHGLRFNCRPEVSVLKVSGAV